MHGRPDLIYKSGTDFYVATFPDDSVNVSEVRDVDH